MRSHLRTVAGLWVAAGFLWLPFVRIVRWWMMLGAVEPAVSLRGCTRPFLLRLSINNTMPLRAGDVVAAFLVAPGTIRALRQPVAERTTA